MLLRRMFTIVSIMSVTALVGCSSAKGTTDSTPTKSTASNSKKANGSATKSAKTAPKSEPKVADLKKDSGSTPPKGAKSVGTKSKPKAGGKSLPVSDLEVYEFSFDYDGDGDEDTLEWAHVDSGSTYIWSETEIECDDGETDGTGGFFMEIKDDGSGAFFFATDSCPEDNLYGCEFDKKGKTTTCGACAFSDEDIACEADDASDDSSDG